MAGKRILDLAALFNASRGVAQKHIALKTKQIDVYNRTSTLARAVRNQTDRVTETAKAASFLAARLNDNVPEWTKEATDYTANSQSNDSGPIPSRKSTKEQEHAPEKKEGLEQDHFYEKSESNSSVDPAPKRDLHIQQEKAKSYPLPDGTIPPQNADIDTAGLNADTTPTRSRAGPKLDPVDSEGLHPAASNASTIPIPKTKPLSADNAKRIQREHERQIPSITADAIGHSNNPLEEGHDEDSFYDRSRHTSPTLSSLPRAKIPKHTSDIQENDQHLKDDAINSDTFSETVDRTKQIPSVETVPEQEQLPEGINTDLFYSPRVARLLGGKTQGSGKGTLGLKGVKDTPLDQTQLARNKDQDTFNVHSSSQAEPTTPDSPLKSVLETPRQNSEIIEKLAADISKESSSNTLQPEGSSQPAPYKLRESSVPSSRLGRLWNYSGLAAGMVGGAISESLRRVGGGGGEGSFMLSAGNMDRLVTKLSRMRGAALKLGQMISFQDSKMLPAPIQEVMQRVQDRADYMPASQRNKVLIANLGPEWRDLFGEFEEVPLAAASIGQVHRATLKSTGAKVAVKIQYPGVADSIDSDLNNLAILLTASRLLPKGLFLDKTIANARTELGWECDYIREAECGLRFQELLADEEDVFVVPKVFSEASGKQVLTMEYMEGVGVTRVQSFTQEQRDWIGTQILRLCLREITEFKYMQTDPNWTNFLYNAQTNKLELLDFGASREYPEEFITKYTQLLDAASRSERDTVRALSIDLGYLTGQESKAMLDAHIQSVLTLAEPFLESSPEIYDFRDQTITERVKALIPIMIRERLAPPPEETYSLHRKLSGAFLLCARLGSRVRCRELFTNSMKKTEFL
ncbi:putative molecular chaperone protein [Botrytis fragariae]|uniref:Putative molecular chaperone protein n=1 Tax=Botrytis fragariae TaxID=1964551 RepID=A0A8H6EKQ7_9HELO|nr:putative molecular chaperone protein [Botrytis fragariae]KAF5875804.1 putative molecular chaperone protein [Botrytis fragariae]